jgi:hypothetical protein
MAKEISNGIHTVKLYQYADRGRRMHQLAYYEAGKRRLRNFSIKSEAETVAWQILGQLTNGISQCRKIIGDLAKAFSGQTLPDLQMLRQRLPFRCISDGVPSRIGRGMSVSSHYK